MRVEQFGIPSSPSPVRFLVHLEEGRIVGLEEHDHYQGGPLVLQEGEWSDLLLQRVAARSYSNSLQRARALEFLHSL